METAQGGVALSLQEQDLASTAMDPAGSYFTGGVGWFDRDTGEGPGDDVEGRGAEVTGTDGYGDVPENGFGKANGLGDLEVLADNAPMQIGNRVWFDEDRDGEQDAAEACLPGANVTLKDSSGQELATTETNEQCEYYFGGADQPDLIDPDTDYTVEFDACSADTSNVPGTPDAADLQLTEPEAVDDTRHDSNPEPSGGRDCMGAADITTPQTQGYAYNTIDAGFYGPEVKCAIGDYVWSDDDENGIQDDGEAPVEGVEVELLDEDGKPVEDSEGNPITATTDEEGHYEFGGIDCGKYKVRFTPPEGRAITVPEAGDDNEVDSNPDPDSGETPVLEVTKENPEDLTIDAGLTPKKCTIGDYVWIDENGNGVQNKGEAPVSGVTVDLLDQDGNPVDDAEGNPITATTDKDGKYLFDPVECGTYRVKFSDTPNGYTFTKPGAGDDPAKDSDPSQDTGITPMFEVTKENPKDLTLDAGLVKPVCLGTVGDKVWDDRNANGIQDSGEPGVPGVTVELLDEDGNVVKTSTGEPARVVTDENGEYRFTKVPCGTYQVRFSNLPEGTRCTKQMAGDDASVDSNPNPRTCVTPKFEVTKTNPKVLTVDAGIIKVAGGPGGGSLPYTGAEIGLVSLLGAVLVGAGTLLLVAVRRRRTRASTAEGPDAG